VPCCTLALEHESREPFELEEKIVGPKRSFEDLVDVENNLLHDAYLGPVRCLLTNPILIDE